jgi:hypothetical protein
MSDPTSRVAWLIEVLFEGRSMPSYWTGENGYPRWTQDAKAAAQFADRHIAMATYIVDCEMEEMQIIGRPVEHMFILATPTPNA